MISGDMMFLLMIVAIPAVVLVVAIIGLVLAGIFFKDSGYVPKRRMSVGEMIDSIPDDDDEEISDEEHELVVALMKLNHLL